MEKNGQNLDWKMVLFYIETFMSLEVISLRFLQYIIASNSRDWNKIRKIRLNPQTEYKCYF